MIACNLWVVVGEIILMTILQKYLKIIATYHSLSKIYNEILLFL